MKSMTGYGRGEYIQYDRKFIVEIKSVNHRYNDMTIKLPRTLAVYEDMVKKLLSKEIFRGKTDVYVYFETYSKKDIKIDFNEVLADGYYQTLTAMKERFSLNDNITLNLLSRFPDIISVEKATESEEEKQHIAETLTHACKEALKMFIAMREKEGAALKDDIYKKSLIIEEMVNKVKERAPMVAQEYRQRLTEKLAELLENTEIDESRIITEAMIFADKACIDEELTRLYSHISQLRSIINETVPVGRKLDFLVQEMNREVNTIGSKSNDLDITNVIVSLKSEIEKIREQIQNIE
ncbi:MAG: YicC family protein [Firmicutes bacterium]|nr:YicC family protein [Bacillota bacterium]